MQLIFYMNFDDKYETNVGEKGVKLSGGQRQRICIARAILKNAPIIMLDEATSSLDSQSESEISNAISCLEDITVIVCAHRLSTIMDSDMIYVIDNGEIVQRGCHEDLVKEEGIYQNCYRLQMEE